MAHKGEVELHSTVNPLPGVETDGYVSTGLQLCHAMLIEFIRNGSLLFIAFSTSPLNLLRLSSGHIQMYRDVLFLSFRQLL